jgi:hypothetical protein
MQLTRPVPACCRIFCAWDDAKAVAFNQSLGRARTRVVVRHGNETIGSPPCKPREDRGVRAHSNRLIVLDVGGTILQDQGDVVEALRGALARRDIVASAAEFGPWSGASKRAVIRHFVDQTLAHEIYKHFVEQVNEAYKSVACLGDAPFGYFLLSVAFCFLSGDCLAPYRCVP